MATQSFNSYLNAGGSPDFTGYRHATKLYLSDNYKRLPKFSHMYFVKFNVHPNVANQLTDDWDKRFTALLAREVQLPKFKISTETINQYNRKTNVQTKVSYEPLSFSFHDDMGGTTNGFWTNYYKYYYADSRYGDPSASPGVNVSYADTKYSDAKNNYAYGFSPAAGTINGSSEPNFLQSIDIYLLHAGPSHKDYTKFRLINPMISSWDHDTVSQGDQTKPLQNKMTIVYEDVIYSSGKMQSGQDDGVLLFEDPAVYDTTPTPLTSGAGGSPGDINYIKGGYGGINSNLSDFTAKIPQHKPFVPPPAQYQKSGLSLGPLINAYNIFNTFKTQPRNAWNIYGINIRNMLTGAVVGAISANPSNVVGRGGVIAGQQGAASTTGLANSTYVNTSLTNSSGTPIDNAGEQDPS
jgi:hypothetical protein